MATNDRFAALLAGLLLNKDSGIDLESVLPRKGNKQNKSKTPFDDDVDEDEEDGTEDKVTKEKNDEDAEDDAPVGMTCDLKNVYQKVDKHNQAVWVNEYPDDLEDPVENKETAKFALLVRNKKSYNSRRKLEIDSIIVQSPLLKTALEPILRDYPGVTTSLDRLTFKAPFAPFVHRWERLLQALDELEESDTKKHLQLLHSVLEEELSDTIANKKDHVANGVITFGHMWTIFEPGALLYSTEYGHDRIYELTSTSTATDHRSGLDFLSVRCWGVDWDGSKFGTSRDHLSNYEFEGTMKITRLSVYPLEFHPNKDRVMKKLLERGRVFEKYAGYHYMAYKGVALGYGLCQMLKNSVDSRIIIDTDAHNKFLPNKAVALGSLGKSASKASIAISSDNEDDDEDSYCGSDYDSSEEDIIPTPDTAESNGCAPKRRALTNRELLLTVPYVRGYALKTKKWLWFFLPLIVPIKFNSSAFTSLVLPAQQKDLILAFVESQIAHQDPFDDIIAGKGKGMILLLSGPPGVGKTLTAESVAENMKVPLYMMSAGDLGLDPQAIEGSLNTILEMVAKWNAVLLLDEADVFLEARSAHDLERNKMVSIFLRVLEYYEGILFLTTNRIRNIDEAFHSRIHISMQYPHLTKESRRHIWKTFAGASGAGAGLTDKEFDELADVDINGRQIKNVLKTSRMLAGRKGEDGVLRMRHVRTVLDIERGNGRVIEEMK